MVSEMVNFSPFSIDVGSDGLFYICVGSTRISSPFKSKEICREACTAVDRSFARLVRRYALKDFHASLTPAFSVKNLDE